MQREAFETLDRTDLLAPLRDQFLLPSGVIYLDGNSLGALPRSTAARVSRVIEREWGEDLITSWNRHDRIGMPQRVGDKIARLIGAAAGEVVVTESTSINLESGPMPRSQNRSANGIKRDASSISPSSSSGSQIQQPRRPRGARADPTRVEHSAVPQEIASIVSPAPARSRSH